MSDRFIIRGILAGTLFMSASCASSVADGKSEELNPSIWSEFGIEEPKNSDVLFWSQTERDAGFRLLDELTSDGVDANPISSGEYTKPLEQGKPLAIAAKIDDYLVRNNNAGIVILHEGKIRYENYGLKLKPEDRWTSFSVAKGFTSTLVGAAIKDGYIESLDAKVSDYIPELKASPYNDVSIEQLLTMSSGVGWTEIYADPESNVVQSGRHVPEEGMAQIVSYMRTLERAHPPGEVWNYSSGETNLIGILVSKATGKTLASYLSEKVWIPYGMEADASWLTRPGEIYEISGCCIQARIRDFARFGQFIMDDAIANGERVVPEGWIERATRGDFDAPFKENLRYGFQWLNFGDGSYGGWGIFGQAIIIDPNRKLIIASNSSWDDAIGQAAGQLDARSEFHAMVKAAIDAEKTTQ